MRRWWVISAMLVTAFAVACGGGESPAGLQCDAATPAEISAAVPRLDSATAAPRLKRWIVETEDPNEARPSNSVPTALANGFSTLEPATAVIERAGGRVIRPLARRRFAAELSEDQVEALKADPLIKRVEADPPRFPLASSTGQQLPWGMSAIGATEAWQAAAPLERGAKVCIIDSGLYAAHGDLAPGGGALDGYPADSWNQDTCGHGTHVAGTIAALDNDTGVVGANPLGADLYVVRVFGGDDCGWTYGSELADAIDRCVAAGARVINMSLGGFSPSTAERDALTNAWRHGAVIVAAAGNEGDTELEYPASYPVVLSVGAVDAERRLTGFSQRNPQVDLVAPGAEIVSTVPFASRHELEVGGSTFSGGPLQNTGESAGVTGPLLDGGSCTSAGSWSGAIVLCRRGTNTFAEKVENARRGGARGAVIFNDETGTFSGTLGEQSSQLPAIALSGEDGTALLAHVGSNATLVNEPERIGSGYASYSGTSMAAPHVAGVASFLLGQNPSSTNAQIRAALLASAQDLGAEGVDWDTGHGLVRADSALAALRSGAPLDASPMAGFLVHCDGLDCTFTDATVPIDGEIVSREYDFGDGVAQAGAEMISHAFSKAGTFTVTLTATDSRGRSAQSAVPVSVISATARAGAIASDGSRPIQLDWSGIKTASVLILRDGKEAGVALNSGAVIATLDDGSRAATWRVCSAGGESCSEALSVLPPCG